MTRTIIRASNLFRKIKVFFRKTTPMKKIWLSKKKPPSSQPMAQNFLSILSSYHFSRNWNLYRPKNWNSRTSAHLQFTTSGNSRTNLKLTPMRSKTSNPNFSVITPSNPSSQVKKSHSFSVLFLQFQVSLLRNASSSVNLPSLLQFLWSGSREKLTSMINGNKKGPIFCRNSKPA